MIFTTAGPDFLGWLQERFGNGVGFLVFLAAIGGIITLCLFGTILAVRLI